MTQQAQRDLLLDGRPGDLFAEQRQSIFQVRVVGRRREFQVDCLAVVARDEQQVPPYGGAALRLPPRQGDQHLLADGPQSVRHLRRPLPPRSEIREERVDRGLVLQGQVRLQAPRARPRPLHEVHQDDHREAAHGHAVPEQLAPRPLEVLGEDPVELERHPQPEGETHRNALAMIEAIVHEQLDPEHEEERDQYDVVGAHHRAGNGDEDGDELRQERQDDEYDSDAHPDDAGGHPSEVGHGDAVGIGGVRYGAHQSGQEVAEAVGGEGALNGLEVDGARLAPRDPLYRDAVSDRVQGAHEGHEDEGRQERPEIGAEAEVDAGPCARRQPDPGGGQDPLDIVDPEEQAADQAACHQSGRRGPQPLGRGATERDGDHHRQGHPGRHRRGRRRGLRGYIGQLAHDDRSDGHRNQHHHGRRHGGREDLPEQGELRGKNELTQR